MKMSRLTLSVLLFGLTVGVGAQSLWSPGFTGYLSGTSSLQVGDLVSVTIDTNTKLSYTSSNVSDRTLTLEFTGGAAGNPLSFLPPGTSSEKSNLKGGEEIKLSTKLVARVQQIDSGGHALIQGSRTLEVNGRAEMVSVTGWIDPAMMTDGKSVGFNELADSKLVYSSTLIQNQPVLTQSDIQQALAQSTGSATTAPQAGAASPPLGTSAAPRPAAVTPPPPSGAVAPTPAATQGAGTTAAGPQITDAKKRQLLLEYLNKMLDLIFSKGSP